MCLNVNYTGVHAFSSVLRCASHRIVHVWEKEYNSGHLTMMNCKTIPYCMHTCLGQLANWERECMNAFDNQVFCICIQQGPFPLGGRDVKPGTQWTLVRKEHYHHGNHRRKHRRALWTLGLASHQQCKYNIVILLEADLNSLMDRHVREN